MIELEKESQCLSNRDLISTERKSTKLSPCGFDSKEKNQQVTRPLNQGQLDE